MAQMTDDQRQQVGIVAERVATKLKAFYDTLPTDEQQVPAVTLAHSAGNVGGSSEQTDDSAGYAARIVAEPLVADAAEAFAAPGDVSGHAILIGGLWFAPPRGEGPVPPTGVGHSGPSFDAPRVLPPRRVPPSP